MLAALPPSVGRYGGIPSARHYRHLVWPLVDSVRLWRAVEAELARLRTENARLRNLLRMAPDQAAPPAPGQAAFYEAPPGMVHNRSPEAAKVAFFGALFAARTDIYATRWENPHASKHGWVPAGSRCARRVA